MRVAMLYPVYMRVLTLVTVLSLLPATWTAAETTTSRRQRGNDDLAEMRAAIATLFAIVDAASRPASAQADAPRLLRESLRSGTADAASMGAIVRWVLEEKEEKVAGAVADALADVDSQLPGIAGAGADAERWNAAARSVMAVFQGALRDAQNNRRTDGEAMLRELQPAIAAAAAALTEAQQKIPAEPTPQN
jgi:translation initiation factor 2B subunit (eIF-2B alpha/beta/delta family)